MMLSVERFCDKGGEWEPTHRGESLIARFVCLAVGFAMATVGRGGCPRRRVVLRAETQIETGIEELLRQRGFAAKTVDGPPRGGAQLLVQS